MTGLHVLAAGVLFVHGAVGGLLSGLVHGIGWALGWLLVRSMGLGPVLALAAAALVVWFLFYRRRGARREP